MLTARHPLRDYLDAVGETVSGFASRVGASRQTLHRIMAGAQAPRPALARRVVAATGGAVPFHALYGDPEGDRVLNLSDARDNADLDRRALSVSLRIVIEHISGAPPRAREIELAVEAIANTYIALAPITTCQGAARLQQALRPVLEEILREYADRPPPAEVVVSGARLSVLLYDAARHLRAPAG